MFATNYLIILERKTDPIPRKPFIIECYASSPESIRQTLHYYPNLFNVITIVSTHAEN